MVIITCKECKESIYLTPHAFWNITDFGYKCPRCNAINTITLEKGEPKEASIAIAQENIRFFFILSFSFFSINQMMRETKCVIKKRLGGVLVN
ncbi:MAG: hypothetical protein WAL46_02690 [Nitrososphaeraceae archaeon]|jgi:hypothetical protein